MGALLQTDRRVVRAALPCVATAAVCLGLFLALHGQPRPRPATERPAQLVPRDRLQPADLLFRRGRGRLTQATLAADPRWSFSHVGVLVLSGGEPFVVHSVPDEPAGDPGSVRAEPLAAFEAPERAEALALYRVPGLPAAAAREISRLAEQASLRRMPFDPEFDLATPDRVYCTELVWMLFREGGGVDLLRQPPPLMSFAMFRRRVITPAALLESEVLHAVWTSR